MKQFRTLAIATLLTLGATMSMAERINVTSNADVDTSVARLVNAVETAGARVFAKVDFSRGAETQGETLRPTTVVIFGSPKIGSTALQAGQTMALYLPLRILFYEDINGQTWATYEDPGSVAPSHGIADGNAAIRRMQAALERFVGIAAGQ